MKEWKCTQCGSIHESEETPEKCKDCGEEIFEEIIEEKEKSPLAEKGEGFISPKKINKLILILGLVLIVLIFMIYFISINSKENPTVENVKEEAPRIEEIVENVKEEAPAEETEKVQLEEENPAEETEKVQLEEENPAEEEIALNTPRRHFWPIIKTFSIGSRNLVVKLRRLNYAWKKINIDPFLRANREWLMEDRIFLAAEKVGWNEEVASGLWVQVKLAMNTNEAEGVVTREVKNGEEIRAMYSGGIRNNEITLDIGKITVNIEYYYKYHYDADGNFTHREKIKMAEDDHINAKSYTFVYEDIVYELLWFEGSLGGISQCGNLALRSFPATK